jgi:hypothetical protein
MVVRSIVLTMVRMKGIAFLAAALSASIGAIPAYADFEQMQIEQVVAGVGGRIDQQAVQLRMRALGQNAIGVARIRAWDNTGSNPVILIAFEASVANGAVGDRVLVVSSAFAAAYGAGDFVMTNPIPPSYLAAGRLTYEDDLGVVYWSLSWGGSLYTGSNAGVAAVNDADGNFGPPFGSSLPTSTAGALAFTGPASAMSTSNLADYAVTPGVAIFTTNAGVLRPLPSEVIFGDGFESGPSCPSGVAWDETSGEVVLCCDSPADGALVDLVPGADVSIRGSALGLSDVHVNGTPVAVAADHTFSATVTGRHGLNFVELSATDGAGATRTGLCAFLGAERWLTEGEQFDDALLFRLEQPGFVKLKTVYHTWFSGPSLPQNLDSALATNIGHTVIGNCGGFGTCADIQYLSVFAVLRPPPAGLVISVNEADETLNVEVRYDISLHLRASGRESGIPFGPITGDALFANTGVSVHVDLGIDPVTGFPVVSGANADVVNLSAADWSQFNGLGLTILNMMVSFVEAQLASSLQTEVLGGAAGLFEGLFAGMDVTLPAAGFPVGRLDGTANVTVALARRHALDLRGNGLTLPTGLRVTAPPAPPNATGRVPLPLFGNLDLPPRAGDAWSAVHVGLFNQVLQALWRAGLFDGTVDGTALGPGLPPGTSLSVQLRTMPVVTGFAPSGLDVGALDLVVTHPDLPPGLRVAVGARIGAQAAFLAGDLVFADIAADELHISTGAVTLDPASQATLQDLIERLLVKLADIALNDSLPVLPEAVFTIPPTLGPYGLPVGSPLVGPPTFVEMDTHRVIWDGQLSPLTP